MRPSCRKTLLVDNEITGGNREAFFSDGAEWSKLKTDKAIDKSYIKSKVREGREFLYAFLNDKGRHNTPRRLRVLDAWVFLL